MKYKRYLQQCNNRAFSGIETQDHIAVDLGKRIKKLIEIVRLQNEALVESEKEILASINASADSVADENRRIMDSPALNLIRGII
jgi:hypothetical protein